MVNLRSPVKIYMNAKSRSKYPPLPPEPGLIRRVRPGKNNKLNTIIQDKYGLAQKN